MVSVLGVLSNVDLVEDIAIARTPEPISKPVIPGSYLEPLDINYLDRVEV